MRYRGPIRSHDSINYGHPLNRGRTAWWLARRDVDGGSTWYDMMGRYPGQMVMGPGDVGWRGDSGRPGGAGRCVRFLGSSSSQVTPKLSTSTAVVVSRVITATAGTLAAWVRPTATPAVVSQPYSLPMVCADTNQYFGLYFGQMTGVTPGRFVAYNYDGSTQYQYSPPYQLGSWYRVAWVHLSGNLFLYVNGVAATGFAGTAPRASGPTQAMNGNIAIGGQGLSGDIDDVSTWDRGLSAVDVVADYEISMAGYVGVLRRRSYSFSGGSSALFLPIWSSQSTQIVGVI